MLGLLLTAAGPGQSGKTRRNDVKTWMASMFSRRCAESSRICMVRRGLETGISFEGVRRGGSGPTT